MSGRLTLADIERKAQHSDVTYDLWRWFRKEMEQRDKRLLQIQRLGFESEALAWLRSVTLERMRYGTATKEERTAKAEEFAAKAGSTLMELAVQHNLQHLVLRESTKR